MNTEKLDSEITILGAGLSSIYAAYKLSNLDTSIIFGQNEIGGILNGQKWKNFYIDNGCHLFDGNKEQLDFFENVGGMIEHQVRYGSFNQGKLSNDIATPEIHSIDLVNSAIEEVQNLECLSNYDYEKYSNIREVFVEKFGDTCGNYLADIQKKFTGQNSENIIPSQIEKFSVFNRIRIGNDQISNQLKKTNSYLDKIICSSLESRGLPRYQRSMYPKKNGTAGFVTEATKFLNKKNIKLVNNFQIRHIKKVNDTFEIISNDGIKFRSKVVLSTLPYPLLGQLLGYVKGTKPDFISYKIIILEVNRDHVLDNYYVQDFDSLNTIYRSSNMGFYSNQFSSDGTTYVMAEIPYHQNFKNIDINNVKDEMVLHKILKKGSQIIDYKGFDKKNIIPINANIHTFEFPKNLYSINPNAFSMKDKLTNIDEISIDINEKY